MHASRAYIFFIRRHKLGYRSCVIPAESIYYLLCVPSIILFSQNPLATEGGRYECHICRVRYTRGTGLTKHLKKQHTFRWPAGHKRFRYYMSIKTFILRELYYVILLHYSLKR